MKTKAKKLRGVRVAFTNGTRALLVVDEKNKVWAGGAFEHEEDAQTAVALVATLLARLGLTGKNVRLAPPGDLDTLLAKVDEEAANGRNFK